MSEPPLHVTRDTGRDRYLVRSQERDKEAVHYSVELHDPDFPTGHCSCEDFGFRLEPELTRKRRPLRDICKHINATLATLEHARSLCDAAGLPFSPAIIPTLSQYESHHR